MRGWIGSCEVQRAKYWECDKHLTMGKVNFYTGASALSSCLYWRCGKPEPDDSRWLPAKEAIIEWGTQDRKWWYKATDGRLCRFTGIVGDEPGMFIPRGRPPIPSFAAVKRKEDHPSAMMCEHANENPNICLCPPNCYCRTRTCKNKPLVQGELRVKRLPVCSSCGTEQEDLSRIRYVISLDSHREKLRELGDCSEEAFKEAWLCSNPDLFVTKSRGCLNRLLGEV